MTQKRNSFSGSAGFILAAAGSAVGLGNIWRFPYLAAKDGGGLFLIVYLVLALTFGYTLLISEVSIGRLTKQSPLTAYNKAKPGKIWKGLGILACVVPLIIMPYYCAIGGWVLKYTTSYVGGEISHVSGSKGFENFFGSFVGHPWWPIVFTVIFILATAFVVYRGVNKGIERLSKVLMPILLVLIIGIAIFSLTIKGSNGTGLDGFKTYIIPNFHGLTVTKFLGVVADAMGQLFYSISVAMGIMIAYGSYLKDKDNLVGSVNKIEFFDTLVAFLAGAMIIPAVVAFMGPEKMQQTAGPSLMFNALPEVFSKMGTAGLVVGAIFFIMVLFAALTSSISILEAIVSSLMDKFKWSRKKAVVVETCIALVIGVIVCLGFVEGSPFNFKNLTLPNGSKGAQWLDIFDYVSNSILMPIVAIGTCIFVGWIIKTQVIESEATKNGEKFGRKHMFRVMVKYIAPILLVVLLLTAFGFSFGV